MILKFLLSATLAFLTLPSMAATKPNQLDPDKIKVAKEICLKETKTVLPKKGEKADKNKLAPLQKCMHEKLAPEIEKLRSRPN
jgi:Na+/phosphate symporter